MKNESLVISGIAVVAFAFLIHLANIIYYKITRYKSINFYTDRNVFYIIKNKREKAIVLLVSLLILTGAFMIIISSEAFTFQTSRVIVVLIFTGLLVFGIRRYRKDKDFKIVLTSEFLTINNRNSEVRELERVLVTLTGDSQGTPSYNCHIEFKAGKEVALVEGYVYNETLALAISISTFLHIKMKDKTEGFYHS